MNRIGPALMATTKLYIKVRCHARTHTRTYAHTHAHTHASLSMKIRIPLSNQYSASEVGIHPQRFSVPVPYSAMLKYTHTLSMRESPHLAEKYSPLSDLVGQ